MSPVPAPVRYPQNTLTSQHLFVNHQEEGSGHLWDMPFLAFVTTASVITPFFEEPMFWKGSITMVWILFCHSISRSAWSHYDIIEQPESVWMERESKKAGLSKGSRRWERVRGRPVFHSQRGWLSAKPRPGRHDTPSQILMPLCCFCFLSIG